MKSLRAVVFLFIVGTCFAQTKTVNIWEGKIPGALENDSVKENIIHTEWGPRIKDVTNPTIKVYFPSEEKTNGTAVLICPGGGYERLAIDKEGDSVAVLLNKLGVTAAVLKYRLPNDAIMENKSVAPLQDAQEAIRVIRRHSKDWGVDPHKIGVMGFSAGGHVASTLSTHYNEKVYETDTTSARPDFSILIYPVISMRENITHNGSKNYLLGNEPADTLVEHFSNELQVDENTPPAFLIHSADDKTVPVANSIGYFNALKEHNIPAELHIYEKGGHGYGLARDRNNTTEINWPKALENWLMMKGFVK